MINAADIKMATTSANAKTLQSETKACDDSHMKLSKVHYVALWKRHYLQHWWQLLRS